MLFTRPFLAAACLFLLSLLAAQLARATEPGRLALLIGNQTYVDAIGKLTNPHNDVALLERALKRLGFTVTVVNDAGLGATNVAINRYLRALKAAGKDAVGFFYYSGHGAADGSTNYLIPVDAQSTDTAELWDQSLRLGEITQRLKVEAGNATHFVVFDACRNTLRLRTPGKSAAVQAKGFRAAREEPGMLISYATAEGELASDVGQGAGPYARVLAEEIVKPGVEAVEMFRRVQRRVRLDIKQEPYLGFNALGDVYFAGKEAAARGTERLAPDGPNIEGVFNDCVKTPPHPLRQDQIERLAAIYTRGGHTYGWRYDRREPGLSKVLVAITSARVRDGVLEMNYAFHGGRLIVVPVGRKGIARSAGGVRLESGGGAGLRLEGVWVQNNGYGCVTLMVNLESGEGDGEWPVTDDAGKQRESFYSIRTAATKPAIPEQVARRSIPVGAPGGGNAFDDTDANDNQTAVTRIEIGVNRSVVNGSELIIGGIQAYFGDVAGPRRGFGGPNPVAMQPFIVAPGETIRSVTMFARRFTWGVPKDAPMWVSGLQVRTTQRTVTFGDLVGTKSHCDIAAGERLVGFYGRAGSYIDQLGCLVAVAAAPSVKR